VGGICGSAPCVGPKQRTPSPFSSCSVALATRHAGDRTSAEDSSTRAAAVALGLFGLTHPRVARCLIFARPSACSCRVLVPRARAACSRRPSHCELCDALRALGPLTNQPTINQGLRCSRCCIWVSGRRARSSPRSSRFVAPEGTPRAALIGSDGAGRGVPGAVRVGRVVVFGFDTGGLLRMPTAHF
jgi:hypothetical protein